MNAGAVGVTVVGVGVVVVVETGTILTSPRLSAEGALAELRPGTSHPPATNGTARKKAMAVRIPLGYVMVSSELGAPGRGLVNFTDGHLT